MFGVFELLIGLFGLLVPVLIVVIVLRVGKQQVGDASRFACPDCGHQVSGLAKSCPNCGRPFSTEKTPT